VGFCGWGRVWASCVGCVLAVCHYGIGVVIAQGESLVRFGAGAVSGCPDAGKRIPGARCLCSGTLRTQGINSGPRGRLGKPATGTEPSEEPRHRTPGRHHVGTPGDIISECPGDFVGIRSPSTPQSSSLAVAGVLCDCAWQAYSTLPRSRDERDDDAEIARPRRRAWNERTSGAERKRPRASRGGARGLLSRTLGTGVARLVTTVCTRGQFSF
jgi:hypothetical protein